MNFADKIRAAQIIAPGLDRQTDDLMDAVTARFGIELAWLATDPEFLEQIAQRVTRDADTRVWSEVGDSDLDDDDDYGDY